MAAAKPFRVSADYIDWAHGPAAEDGQRLATLLCELTVHPHPIAPYVLVDDATLVHEIAAVAELYVEGEVGDNDRRAGRVRARALKWLAAAKVQA